MTGYLKRLGADQSPAPDLDALCDLMRRHMQTVPFENLDIVAGMPRELCTDAVVRKVLEGRGGFCYELNEAFRALLEHLGFQTRRIEARVWQARANRFGAPFDHLALVVSLPAGDYLVDVGYGDSNRAPLRLPDGRAADLSGEYRLRSPRSGILELASATAPLYEMTLREQPLDAFAEMCRFHQTSSESVFAKGLICTLATDTGRITLSGRRLTIVDRGLRTESFPVNVDAALLDYFKIGGTQLSASLR